MMTQLAYWKGAYCYFVLAFFSFVFVLFFVLLLCARFSSIVKRERTATHTHAQGTNWEPLPVGKTYPASLDTTPISIIL